MNIPDRKLRRNAHPSYSPSRRPAHALIKDSRNNTAMGDYCRALTKAQDFSDVVMTGVDRYGFEMSVETPDGWRPIRLAFDTPVKNSTEVRDAMRRIRHR